ncbi:hypothetical protein N7509_006319 [Penicillium cosmopolitanum]|uniref:Thioester reductase (TE) domain-containing protein n=1 Tax=Penicillium cosmopolitanum TaxID=1131564 RepID=A0A9X0BAV1_9EURO|nr:uncharacterized protein N7509_006319 [Penicillium cosmopolitanum]KAJ5398206.1 hypothetical protein N7509_006319 [Penicillium cosmopolitanum]
MHSFRGEETELGEEINVFAQENIPSFMVPDTIEFLSAFPLTHRGKVDRPPIAKMACDRKTHIQSQQQANIARRGASNISSLAQLWKDVLGVTHVHEQDDFFLSGVSSIQSAAFITAIYDRTGHLITTDELYHNSELGELEKLPYLRNFRDQEIPDDTMTCKRDIDLVDDLSLVIDWESEDEGKVFITGATGFVGINMLRDLLDRPRVKQVACLVRKKGNSTAESRVYAELERYDLFSIASPGIMQKIMVLEGDMADDNLSLGEETFKWLANWASVIFHIGAKVNFCDTYQQHYRDNVLGTRNVLRLAATGRRSALHYMSSIDVWGLRASLRVRDSFLRTGHFYRIFRLCDMISDTVRASRRPMAWFGACRREDFQLQSIP